MQTNNRRHNPSPSPTPTRRQFLAATSLALAAACSKSQDPAPDVITWGKQGLRDGHFLRPRAIAYHFGKVFVHPEIYVVDTTGRVQVFDPNGKFIRLWNTPSADNGTPTGIAPVNGQIVIPDTHYSRILQYDRYGKPTKQWGSYGAAPDQFIYPTDIVVGADGRWYLSEYGNNAERIHIFNDQGEYQEYWGTFGEKPGEYNRAMAIDCDKNGNFYIADTGNHRVQVLDPKGSPVQIIGAPDSGDGALKFPFDLALAPDDTLLVADYGRHQILRYKTTGAFIAAFGTPGRAPGQFDGPRGVTVSPEGQVYVADTDNHRIQSFSIEKIA